MKPRQRLRNGREFALLKAKGSSYAGRYVVISVLGAESDEEKQESFRAGIITSRKVGNAVTRNLVRRRLRAIIDEVAARLPPGMRLVTIARFRAAQASYQSLRRDWLRQAHRAGILCPVNGSTRDLV